MANMKAARSDARAQTTRRMPEHLRRPDAGGPSPIAIDPFRGFVFPNRVREQRQRHGYPKLLALAAALPEIPYIRLSKIERGEIFARADELRRIGIALGVDPVALLVDVGDPAFEIARWSEPFRDTRPAEIDEERFAVMLAAATRARRTGDAALTIATIDRDFGIPPVILSRIENALKPLDRWNEATRKALCRLFGVKNEAALRELVERRRRDGDLDAFLGDIANPAQRVTRTRQRVDRLRDELAQGDDGSVVEATAPPATASAVPAPAAAIGTAFDAPRRRLVPVFGSPLPGGLIALAPTGSMVEAPAVAGPSSFGLRVCRPTLGGGLPGHATVIVDPDRFPAAGSLAVIREGTDYRLVTTTLDREGRMKGFSLTPDVEVAIDALDPKSVAAVIAGIFV